MLVSLLQEDGGELLQESGFLILLNELVTVARGLKVQGLVDSNGSLVIQSMTAGTPSTPKKIQSLSLTSTSSGYIAGVSKTAGSSVGPLTKGSALKAANDDNSALQIAAKTAGSLTSRLTPFSNLRLRTDENGYILVAETAIGTVTNAPIKPLSKLRCCTDENGYLRVAIVP